MTVQSSVSTNYAGDRNGVRATKGRKTRSGIIGLDVVDIELLAVFVATKLEPTLLVTALIARRFIDLGILW